MSAAFVLPAGVNLLGGGVNLLGGGSKLRVSNTGGRGPETHVSMSASWGLLGLLGGIGTNAQGAHAHGPCTIDSIYPSNPSKCQNPYNGSADTALLPTVFEEWRLPPPPSKGLQAPATGAGLVVDGRPPRATERWSQ